MEKIVTGDEKFCQLKELVRSEALVLMVGIDIGKRRHTACIRVRGQVVIKNFSFENTRAGFERLEEKVEQVSKKSAEFDRNDLRSREHVELP